MNKKSGFTVIELMVVVVFFITAGIFFMIQKEDLNVSHRDETRKSAINTIYYSLENVFYKQNGYYPEKLESDTLESIDPNTLTDPKGVNLGKEGAEYQYEATDCQNQKCKHFTLRAKLEREGDYVKTSKN